MAITNYAETDRMLLEECHPIPMPGVTESPHLDTIRRIVDHVEPQTFTRQEQQGGRASQHIAEVLKEHQVYVST